VIWCPPTRGLDPIQQVQQQRAQQVGQQQRAVRGQPLAAKIEQARLQRDLRTARIVLDRRDAETVVVEREHRGVAELGGGDGEHSRAGADVEHRAPGRIRDGQRQQQLEAQTRRGVRTRAKRLCRIDHDLDRLITVAGWLPRGSYMEGGHASRGEVWRARVIPTLRCRDRRFDQHRLVKALPALGPVVRDLAA
jgi:hypothetical protein